MSEMASVRRLASHGLATAEPQETDTLIEEGSSMRLTHCATLALIAPAVLAGCTSSVSSAGSDYPTQTIRMLVPFSAGGPTDLMARSLAKCFEKDFEETVIVENNDGGSGAVAMSEVAAAPTDGHTLALTTTPPVALTPLQVQEAGYTKDSFSTVGLVAESPSILLVAKNSKYQDLASLLADAKANPGTVSIATPGASSLYSLVLEELKEQSGLNFEIVPFDGTSPAVPALLGGHVDALFTDAAQTQIDLVESGDARIISAGAERAYLPDAPSLDEATGYDLPASSQEWFVAGPADLEPDAKKTLETTVKDCLEKPAVVQQIGGSYIPDPFVGSQGAKAHLDNAAATYKEAMG